MMQRRDFLAAGAASIGALSIAAPRVAARTTPPADITELSALDLSAAIRKKKVSCREVMEAYLARIGRVNPAYNAIVSLRNEDMLLREADAADAELARGDYRGWMHGMPHAVKDLANVKGVATSFGSPLFAGQVAAQDDLPIARIRSAGAIFIGKTNTPEFGLGSQSYNPVFGATGGAYDPSLTAGGSSGGAACALALHLAPVADGSDMMGSLRNPGAYNNIIGFRPSIGRVPAEPGDEVFYSRLPVSGPMGRDSDDAMRLLCTMAGSAPSDPLSQFDRPLDYRKFRPARLENVKIGWLADYDGALQFEPGIIELCEESLKALQSAGAEVESATPAYDMDQLWRTWLVLRHWAMNPLRPLYDDPTTRAKLKPELIWEIEGSLALTGADIHRAGEARSEWFRALGDLFDRYDFLALPTAQVFPFSRETHWPTEINGRKMDTYHRWMEVVIGPTLAGAPTVNAPVGFDAAGRPMGMQIIGRHGADQKVLELARAYEEIVGHLERRPTLAL